METETPSWERFKENAAPLQRGRNVATLEQSFLETDQDRQNKENSIRHYESLVSPSEAMAENGEDLGPSDDPLIHWLSYIKFYEEFFPADTQSKYLLMERCVRALLSQKIYANDRRFVQICCYYADQSSDPAEIFQFLYNKKIGVTIATFWCAWAMVAERKKNFRLAEKIYKKGLSKKPKPFHTLEQRFKQFGRRMTRHWLNAAQEAADGVVDEEGEDANNHGGRGILGGLSEEAVRRNNRSSSHSHLRSNQSSSRHQGAGMSTFIDRSAPSRRQAVPLASARNGNVPKNNNRNHNTAAASTGFQIFVEEDQENDGYGLDHSLPVNSNRQLPREADRLKENTLAAEPWNKRGGMHNTAHFAAPAPTHPPLPPRRAQAFTVHVDEECAAQHQREELMQQAEESRRRNHRDERTFRPLAVGESVAEKLYQDPLRYLKDPSLLGRERDDTAEGNSGNDEPKQSYSHVQSFEQNQQQQSRGDSKINNQRHPIAFDKLLVKDESGQEVCFEEQRLLRGQYKLVSSDTNFNLLHKQDQANTNDSAMDIDESTTAGDLSMEDATSHATIAATCAASTAAGSSQKENSRRVLFRANTSYETRDRSINVSQASSTVNEALAVGVHDPEEETINTKWAMKEMSMMFYSPAVGLDTAAKQEKRAKAESENQDILSGYANHHQQTSFASSQGEKNTSYGDDYGANGDTASFDIMKDLVESLPMDPNNSVLHDGEREVGGARKGSALRPAAQDGPLSRAKVNKSKNDAGFTVFEDSQEENPRGVEGNKKAPLFEIHQDEPVTRNEQATACPFAIHIEAEMASSSQQKSLAPAFSIFQDEKADVIDGTGEGNKESAKSSSSAFSIFQDDKAGVTDGAVKGSRESAKSSSSAFSSFQDDKTGVTDSAVKGSRESAKSSSSGFPIFEDKKKKPSVLKERRRPASAGFAIHEDGGGDDDDSSVDSSKGGKSLDGDGDTASLSLFNGLMASICEDDDEESIDPKKHDQRGSNASQRRKGSTITDPNSFGDISMIDNDMSVAAPRNLVASPTITMNFGIAHAKDYCKTYRNNIKAAIKRLRKSASGNVENNLSLMKALSAKHQVYDVPKYVLPRVFRRKLLDQGAEIKIGRTSGTIKQELGRGAYGVVVLLNIEEGDSGEKTVALKAQSSIESLAWEYEIIKKIEDRIGPRWNADQRRQKSSPFPFPKGLAFVALADGGLMSMTAASESGLNLVDVVNMYNTQLGEKVPELIAIHYTARMLHHLEKLHWHGKILHCDVKPDNWVLCSSDGIDARELVLVDYGRAIDLSELATDGIDAMDVKLSGDAMENDMMCVAMRNQRPWSFDVDTFGVCASAHVLLFGTHIEIERGSDKKWMPRQHFRRYHQASLWRAVFGTLLNHDEGTLIGSRPKSLRALREKLEDYVSGHAKQLDDLLRKQARMLPTSRPQLNPTGGKR